jgi:hypothetical protein
MWMGIYLTMMQTLGDSICAYSGNFGRPFRYLAATYSGQLRPPIGAKRR